VAAFLSESLTAAAAENPKRQRQGFLIWGNLLCVGDGRAWWASYSPSLPFILILNLNLSWFCVFSLLFFLLFPNLSNI
jgi:hypothetical protein